MDFKYCLLFHNYAVSILGGPFVLIQKNLSQIVVDPYFCYKSCRRSNSHVAESL